MRTIYNLVYSEFDLTTRFRFACIILQFGADDVYKLCSKSIWRGGKLIRWDKYCHGAELSSKKIKVTAEMYYLARERYLEALQEVFDCPVIDIGAGFPSVGDPAKDPGDMVEENYRSSNEPSAMLNFNRVRSYYFLMGHTGPMFGEEKRTPYRFHMPFHQVTFNGVPSEPGLGRVCMHVLNCIELLLAEWKMKDQASIFLCSGTPQ